MAEFVDPEIDRTEFYRKLDEYYQEKPAKKPYPKEKMDTVIEEILIAKAKQNKTKNRREYHLINTYDVLTIGDTSYLIKKSQKEETNGEFLVCYEELYDRIYDNHVNKTSHGGRVKMEKEFKSKLQIPRPALEIFLVCCKKCNDKKHSINRTIVPTVLSKEFCQQGQVDLIDFQSLPDGNFKWILNYQDYSTKFVVLRPLLSNRAEEVAMQLLNIFLLIGAPKVLQSNLGRAFVDNLVQELHGMWPELIIVNGRPKSVEEHNETNKDIEGMIQTWMQEKESKQWSVGLDFIQWKNNSSFQNVLGRSPYKSLFGVEPQLGLASTKIPFSVAKNLRTEEDFEQLMQKMGSSAMKASVKRLENTSSLTKQEGQINEGDNSDNFVNIKIEPGIEYEYAITCCICKSSMAKQEQQCEDCHGDFHEGCRPPSNSKAKGLLCNRCYDEHSIDEQRGGHRKKVKIELD